MKSMEVEVKNIRVGGLLETESTSGESGAGAGQGSKHHPTESE
jgi:hypothetical protein